MNSNPSPWINTPLPPMDVSEQREDAAGLARLSKILRLGNQYWGGVWAFVVMVLLMLAVILLVTNATVFQYLRTWVVQTDALVRAHEWRALSMRWAVVMGGSLVLWAVYQALLRSRRWTRERVHAWGLAVLIVLLQVISVKMMVELINWRGSFWESVKNRERDKFIPDLILFCKLTAAWVAAFVYARFFMQVLQMRWRTWLTEQYVRRYLACQRFYQMEQVQHGDNPDQKIADDLNRFTELAVTLFFGLFLACLSVYEYSVSIMGLSGDLDTQVFGVNIHIPYYMFWAVIAYTAISSILVHYIGRRLVSINILRERYNADFRYHLVRAREYAEGIALLQGQGHHLRGARHLFTIIRANWQHYIQRIKVLGLAQFSLGSIATVFAILVATPRYYAGLATFGSIMAVISVFNSLNDALSWFIQNYSALTDMRAAATRIVQLDEDLARVDAVQQQSGLYVSVNNNSAVGISFDDTVLNRPLKSTQGQLSETQQVQIKDWQIKQGERWLITGASGAGKSTILRAIAGLWGFGEGHISTPPKSHMVFLPQRPYMPIGSLREVLAYPAVTDNYTAQQYAQALAACGLPRLQAQIDEFNNWAWHLSEGEQQRIAFARLFLQHPDYVFLDEASSALDETSECELYARLLEHLPAVTLVSVSHRMALVQFHQHHVRLDAQGQGGFVAERVSFQC